MSFLSKPTTSAFGLRPKCSNGSCISPMAARWFRTTNHLSTGTSRRGTRGRCTVSSRMRSGQSAALSWISVLTRSIHLRALRFLFRSLTMRVCGAFSGMFWRPMLTLRTAFCWRFAARRVARGT